MKQLYFALRTVFLISSAILSVVIPRESAFAASELTSLLRTFHLPDKNVIKIQVPKNWESAEELFGLPVTLLGPEVTETRPTIGIQPLPVEGKFDSKGMQAAEPAYQAGRSKWVEKQDGTVIQFIPYSFEKSKTAELHRYGVEYMIAGIHFIEWNYHLFCNQKLYMVTALFESKHPVQSQKDAEAAIRSIDCK